MSAYFVDGVVCTKIFVRKVTMVKYYMRLLFAAAFLTISEAFYSFQRLGMFPGTRSVIYFVLLSQHGMFRLTEYLFVRLLSGDVCC